MPLIKLLKTIKETQGEEHNSKQVAINSRLKYNLIVFGRSADRLNTDFLKSSSLRNKIEVLQKIVEYKSDIHTLLPKQK